MTPPVDAIVIGAGVNGLAAAATLAKTGHRVLVLERGEAAGGQGRSLEFAPGFRADPLGMDAGWLPPPMAKALGLAGIERTVPELTVAVPAGPKEWLALSRDPSRAAEAIRRHSVADAGRWGAFTSRMAKLSGFLESLYTIPPADIDSSALADLLPLLGVLRKLRGLGRADMVELLRTVPMSVQELLDDWFECASLKAAVGAGGVRNIRQGPRSGGTAFVLLHHQVGAPAGAMGGRGFWTAGPDALIARLIEAARGFGVQIRCGADVHRVLVSDDRTAGVVLASGEEIRSASVLSTADPARTLLGMVDPVWLDPEFRLAVSNIKFRGSSSKVLYALDALPEFPGLPEPDRSLRGTLSLTGTLDELERAADAAKYGAVSDRLHIELQVQSLRWPEMAPSGKHVMVAHAQWTPHQLREGAWNDQARTALADRVTKRISGVAPGFAARVRHREVLTPVDLETRYRLTEGAITQGEMTLDQILFMRPVAGAARYATPIAGLYLGGVGSHPGSGIAGGPGWLAAKRLLRDWRDRGAGG